MRENADEFGRNPKEKAPCFCSMIFCADRSGRIVLHFPKISEHGKFAEKERTNLGDLLFPLHFNFLDKDMTFCRFWWVGGRQAMVIVATLLVRCWVDAFCWPLLSIICRDDKSFHIVSSLTSQRAWNPETNENSSKIGQK